MNDDSSFQSELPDSDPDAELDLLLSEAKWPEADDEVLGRLTAVVKTELQEADPNLIEPIRSLIEIKSRYQQRWMVVALSLAGMVFAFLAGRWTTLSGRQSDIARGQQDLNSSKMVQTAPVSEQMALPGNADEKNSAVPVMSDEKALLANNQSRELSPSPDPIGAKRKRLSQRDKMKQQLDSVLACLEEGQNANACCQPLLQHRAQFEYLLTEVVRTATGQRQTAAIAAMGLVGSDGSVPLLLKVAEKPDLRTTALQSMKRASSEQMLAALILQCGESSIRKELLTELAHRKSPQAASIWLHLVRTAECRELCLQVVDELSPDLVNQLFVELDAPVIDDRLAAIQSLGRRVDEATFRRTELLCQNFPHRWEPVAVLMWSGSEPSMKLLARLQKNPERFAVIQTAAVQLEAATGASTGSR